MDQNNVQWTKEIYWQAKEIYWQAKEIYWQARKYTDKLRKYTDKLKHILLSICQFGPRNILQMHNTPLIRFYLGSFWLLYNHYIMLYHYHYLIFFFFPPPHPSLQEFKLGLSCGKNMSMGKRLGSIPGGPWTTMQRSALLEQIRRCDYKWNNMK